MEWSMILEKVKDVIRRYNALTLVEVNNQGDVFYEMLKKDLRNNVEPFVTTSTTKPELIEDLAVAFEQKEISIKDEQWLVDELDSFTYIYNPKTRSVKYSAPEGMHDDGVISTALAWRSKKTMSRKGKYTVIRA
jgi:hypothetical protein